MGGSHARVAAITAALFALALGPAQASAEGPSDAASAARAVQQSAAEVAGPVLGGTVPAAPSVPATPVPGGVHEALTPAAGDSPAQRPSDRSDSGASPARPHQGVARSAPAPRAAPRPTTKLASGDARRTPPASRAGTSRRSAKRSSAAESGPAPTESRPAPTPRHPAPTTAAAPSPDQAPIDTGTSASPHGFAAPGGFLFTAFLVTLLAAARPSCMRPFRTSAPILRRLAVISPGVPPG
jgi:hypothetical protein